MKKTTRICLIATVLCQAQTLFAQEPLNQATAFSRAGEELPRGARVVSEREFRKRLDASEIELLYSSKTENQNKLAKKSQQTIDEKFEKLSTEFPRLKKLVEAPPRGSVEPTEDGNYFFEIKDNEGNRQTVVLSGEQSTKAEIVHSFERANLRSTQLGIYTTLYQKLPSKFIVERAQDLGIVHPSTLREVNIIKIKSAIKTLVKFRGELRPYLASASSPPPGMPSGCDLEIGDGVGSDRTGGVCAHSPNGIYESTDYPLKWFATCVKNQGNRGTCVSFASTAAVETAVAVKYDKWTNLSEQTLYNKAKQDWYPSTFGDGLNTAGISEDLDSKNYKFAYEYRWDYNPSYDRIIDQAYFTYEDSCDGYSGEHCSDTNHQGDLVCVQILIWNYCGYENSVAAVTPYEVTNSFPIWNLLTPDFSIDLAELYTYLKVPLTAGLKVTESFDDASSDGYVTYLGANESSRGGHAVQVLAAIPNSDLPSSIQGAGGGYLVIKNSWGACWKDAGYVYVPYSWAKKYFTSLNAISSLR